MTFNTIQTQATLRRGDSNFRVFSGLLVLLAAIVLLLEFLGQRPARRQRRDQGHRHRYQRRRRSGAVVTATSTTRGRRSPRTTTTAGDFNLTPLNPDIYTSRSPPRAFRPSTSRTSTSTPSKSPTSSSPDSRLRDPDVNVSDRAAAAGDQQRDPRRNHGERDVLRASHRDGSLRQPDQRRATDFAFLMPGVQGNNTNGNATTNTGIVNGSGSRGAVSAVYIDGIPFVRAGGNGDPRYVWTAISVDAVDQFQVQTSGYSAIYEGQGIQNYTIKAGGNKYHGAVYEFFRNTALDTWGFFGPIPNPATGVPSQAGRAQQRVRH